MFRLPAAPSNFALHIMAIAKAAEIPLTLREFDRIQEEVPLIARFKPSSRYNMLDYGRAGGALASLKAIEPLLHTEVPTVSGLTLGELLERYPGSSDSEITTRSMLRFSRKDASRYLRQSGPGGRSSEKKRRGSRPCMSIEAPPLSSTRRKRSWTE